MTTLQFTGTVQDDNTLAVPADVVERLPAGQAVRVILVIDDENDDRAWSDVALRSFGMGYADSDAIYDQLSAG